MRPLPPALLAALLAAALPALLAALLAAALPALLAALLAAALPASASPLEGAWQSHREATLDSLAARGGFSERQWQAFRDPELFGHMVQVFRGERGFVIFDGACTPWRPMEVEPRDPHRIRLRYDDDRAGDSWREVDLSVDGDRLRVPIQLLDGAEEVFVRVSAEEVAEKHPCFARRLEELEVPAAPGP